MHHTAVGPAVGTGSTVGKCIDFSGVLDHLEVFCMEHPLCLWTDWLLLQGRTVVLTRKNAEDYDIQHTQDSE